jgi:hypothetical protein
MSAMWEGILGQTIQIIAQILLTGMFSHCAYTEKADPM